MDFRIISGNSIDNLDKINDLQTVYSGNKIRVEAASNQIMQKKQDERLLIILGEVYGYQSPSSKLNIITNIFSYLGASKKTELQEKLYMLEGRFAVVEILDSGETTIFLDKYAKLDIFYKKHENMVIAGTRLNFLGPIATNGYNQEALIHTLTYYGSRPPKKHTFYNDVKRIGVGQNLKLICNNFYLDERVHTPHKISEYTKRENDEYVDYFLNRLETTGSHEGNVVFLSSGWDSTSILAGLIHIFGKRKVSAIIGRMKLSDRSGVCNKFEIERAQKIAAYYDIPIEIVDFEYLDSGPEFLEQHRNTLKQHQLYSLTALSHSRLCWKASEIAKGKAVFAGEISDGAHNLGFSQYATIFHKDYEFRQYSDKMASYLFGPTFYESFLNGNYKDDLIYTLLGGLKGNISIDDAHTSKDILISFFLRNGRYPGWSLENVPGITKYGADTYTNEFYEQYLKTASSTLDKSNLYSWYLHLYNSFHWQGSTVSTLPLFAKEYSVKMDLPFWDANIQNFLSEMPENWGRGLDLKPTKYPLKWMLENRLDYPMHLQTGPHSYTYDVDHSFNHAVEVFYHSKMKEVFQDSLKDRAYHDLLSKDYFNLDYYDSLVDMYLNNQEMDLNKFNDLIPLIYLSYIGWY